MNMDDWCTIPSLFVAAVFLLGLASKKNDIILSSRLPISSCTYRYHTSNPDYKDNNPQLYKQEK